MQVTNTKISASSFDQKQETGNCRVVGRIYINHSIFSYRTKEERIERIGYNVVVMQVAA
jgi:hypothetical protein